MKGMFRKKKSIDVVGLTGKIQAGANHMLNAESVQFGLFGR